MSEVTSPPEIRPTKPVAKPTKQLSSVVRVVSANPVAPSNVSNAPKSVSSKVQIVSSHVEVIDESKKSPQKSVVHVEAIDGGSVGSGSGSGSDAREYSTILPSRVEVVGGVSPSESCVDYLIISFHSPFSNSNIHFIQFSFISIKPQHINACVYDCRVIYETKMIKISISISVGASLKFIPAKIWISCHRSKTILTIRSLNSCLESQVN